MKCNWFWSVDLIQLICWCVGKPFESGIHYWEDTVSGWIKIEELQWSENIWWTGNSSRQVPQDQNLMLFGSLKKPSVVCLFFFFLLHFSYVSLSSTDFITIFFILLYRKLYFINVKMSYKRDWEILEYSQKN